MKKTAIVGYLCISLSLTACQTVEGLKEDINALDLPFKLIKSPPETSTTDKTPLPENEITSSATTSPLDETLITDTTEIKRYALTIHVIPKDSTIKIMNIKPKYHAGILLKTGKYTVQVQHKDYHDYKASFDINKTTQVQVVLTKKALIGSEADNKVDSEANNKPVTTPVVKNKEALNNSIKPPSIKKTNHSIPILLRAHQAPVTSLTFSHNGQYMASGSVDKTVIVWQIATQTIKYKLTHLAKVNALAFSPDDMILATTGDDKTVRLWSMHSGEVEHILRQDSAGISLSFHPNKDLLLSADKYSLWLWNIRTQQLIRHIELSGQKINDVKFNPQPKNTYDFAYASHQQIVLANLDSDKTHVIKEKGMVHAIDFEPTGKYLAWGTVHQRLNQQYFPRFYDWKSQKINKDISLNNEWADASDTNAVAFSHDGKYFAMSAYGEVIIYDVATGKIKQRYSGHPKTVSAIAFGANNDLVTAAKGDNTVRLWKMK